MCKLRFSLALAASLSNLPAFAQFVIAERPVQVHGFFSQGFAYSNVNNFLTMPTSKGSFEFTDGGVNVSVDLSSKFRVGAQAYSRNIGKLGEGRVNLDWASGDYRFSDWLSVRAGKVKTVLGLYNDNQDTQFIHTWAILPQSIYPLDLREISLAHVGGDLYGNLSSQRFGQLSYTAYAGKLSDDRKGGYRYGIEATGVSVKRITGRVAGGDLRWTTPVKGLLLGASYLAASMDLPDITNGLNSGGEIKLYKDHRPVFYSQYARGNLRLEAEYSREIQNLSLTGVTHTAGFAVTHVEYDRRAWYAAAAYRLSKHLELGTYHSRFFPDADKALQLGIFVLPDAARHVFDQVITGRIDINRYCDFKVEGHFIDGYGDLGSFRGFYPQDNPQGVAPKTNLLVLRLGLNF